MEIEELVQQLQQLLEAKEYRKLRELTEDMQPADLAEAMEEMDVQQRLLLFRLMKKDVAAEIFAWLGQEARGELIEKFSDTELTAALEEMALDDAADILEEMPASVGEIQQKDPGQPEPAAELPGRFRRQHHDAGVYPAAQGYDRDPGAGRDPAGG